MTPSVARHGMRTATIPMTLSGLWPGFQGHGILTSGISRRWCESLYKAQLYPTETVQKNWGHSWFFFCKKTGGRCFTPVIDIKPKTLTAHWNFHADIQLTSGKFWLQLWTLKKFSEPRVSRNDGAKEVEKLRKLHLFAAMTVTFRFVCCA